MVGRHILGDLECARGWWRPEGAFPFSVVDVSSHQQMRAATLSLMVSNINISAKKFSNKIFKSFWPNEWNMWGEERERERQIALAFIWLTIQGGVDRYNIYVYGIVGVLGVVDGASLVSIGQLSLDARCRRCAFEWTNSDEATKGWPSCAAVRSLRAHNF